MDSSDPACSVCGARADGSPPLDWSSRTGNRGTTWLCGRCTRDNLRSIEGRLDECWW
jgi:hypothetical protein